MKRQQLFFFLFGVVGLIFILRLFTIQMLDPSYKLSADNNAKRIVKVYPPRGFVYDRNGELLVANQVAYDLMVIPRQVKAFDTIRFAQLLGIDRAYVKSELTKARVYSPYRASVFLKMLTVDDYARVQERLNDYRGFFVQRRILRDYTVDYGANVFGFIGEVTDHYIKDHPEYEMGDLVGQAGIEKAYEEVLRGKAGVQYRLVDNFNREMGPYMEGQFDRDPLPGKDVTSTIDGVLQAYGEALMSGKRGSIVAIEPSTGEILVSNTVINQWEELTFDFSAVLNAPSSTGIDQIIIFPDFTQRSDNRVCLIDNIKFSNQNGGTPIPMGPAPTPTYPTANVISLFSNPYQNVPVDTWMAPWSMAQVIDLQITGNDTKRYDALNFAGVEMLGNNILDVSSMTHFRVDFWTPNMSEFKVKLVDFGADGQYAGGDDSESELSYALPTETWHSLEIPLSSFTQLNSTTHIAQLIFSGTPSGSGTVYIDNVLFFNNEGASLLEEQSTHVRVYPNPCSDKITLNSMDSPLNSVQIVGLDGTLLMECSPQINSYAIDLSNLPTGLYFVRLSSANRTETLRLIKK